MYDKKSVYTHRSSPILDMKKKYEKNDALKKEKKKRKRKVISSGSDSVSFALFHIHYW